MIKEKGKTSILKNPIENETWLQSNISNESIKYHTTSWCDIK